MSTATLFRWPNRLFSVLFLLAGIVCSGNADKSHSIQTKTGEEPTMAFELTSSAFEQGKPIPLKYTCDGPDVSPPLRWSGTPEGTKSLVLICDDPDAPVGTWVHWVLYNIAGDRTELPEGIAKEKMVLGNARQGINDFQRIGYGGPCPPGGKPHRYFFKLYALDIESAWEPGLTKEEVLEKMEHHVLGQAELMGTYQR